MATLAETVADALLDAVVAGRYPAGTALPPEGELATAHGASRLTVREAVRILRATNVLEVRRGLGTYVTPPERWRSLDLLVRTHDTDGAGPAVPELLLEARRMVEVGAARLAALRRTEEHLTALRAGVEEMRAASTAGEVDRFVDADIAFHDTVMRATGNVFVPFLLEPFGALLVAARRQTSSVPRIRDNAVAEHARIIDALTAADPDLARDAMESHMNQTLSDLREHVLGTGS
ncbi:FadR/GntR family transcriptional regulator [Pseudonocardia sp. N23]|uniref:FadR/GntR family transcriptional regulator n=1 Tax=Pseudonocardia sp. N23 TaxID=1987376 RepID=UPI000BFE5188|nr:FadR/GntR family transcriptional regulator [Pseudonocardia sp. N23]GAY11462.1 transcriptional regulator, GntR family [Pseudonocardia sp. N23]